MRQVSFRRRMEAPSGAWELTAVLGLNILRDGSSQRDTASFRRTDQVSRAAMEAYRSEQGKLPPADGSSRWRDGSLRRHSVTVSAAMGAYRETR